MARIDAAYNYLLSTYGKATGSRYDSHKKSELRSLYNNIIKTNKESPLYKITQTGDVKEFAIDIKAMPSHAKCHCFTECRRQRHFFYAPQKSGGFL